MPKRKERGLAFKTPPPDSKDENPRETQKRKWRGTSAELWMRDCDTEISKGGRQKESERERPR
jgi:hypothetical protein